MCFTSIGVRKPRLLVAAALSLAFAGFAACEPGLQHKTLEMQPIGTVRNDPPPPPDAVSPSSGTLTKSDACTGLDFDPLDKALEPCEVPMPKPSELPSGLKDKLDVKVTPSTPQISGGGRVDLTVVVHNKSNEPVVLFFSGDPTPRFDVEAFDARGKRVDIPSGKQPPWPKGAAPPVREVKASRVTLEKNGSARMKVSWDAMKMKWAPDLAKTWDGRGYPRVPSGPLPKGKYALRVVLPLITDVDAPKVAIEVEASKPDRP